MSSVRNLLFLCTGNSARSILAEALLNRHGSGRFRAFSAGSRPRGSVHPAALALLSERGFEVDTLRSKSWDEFAGSGAPPLDIVITVCGNAAGEACPVWPGRPTTAHWGIPDPATVEGADQRRAFERAFDGMKARIDRLVALDLDALDADGLRRALGRIGDLAEAGAA